MDMFDLTGKVALITGGNGGLGLGMARGLFAAGARVVLAGRNSAKGAQAVRAFGERGTFLQVDVTQRAECEALIAKVVELFGRLDILINNAGTAVRKQPQDLTDEEWKRVMDTNLTSTFMLCRAAYPHLVKSGNGKVINIGSMMSIFAAPHTAPYAASKGGVVQFTRSIATAWAKDNIQANAILPGWIDTELTAGARAEVEGLNEAVLARTPAGRWGRPEDLAGLAVFLAAPASNFVTGAAIPCDGGYATRG